MSAEEGANILKHLEMVKDVWSHINLLGDDLGDKDFRVSDFFFKAIIASSLPPSWDNFTETYIGGNIKLFRLDPKKMMGSQEFIGLIISEYRYQETRKTNIQKVENTNTAITSHHAKQFTKKAKQPLIKRIAEPQSRTTTPHKKADEKPHCCKLCSCEGHVTNDCLHWTDSHCSYCQHPSHKEDECWHKNKDKRPEWWGKPKISNP